MRATCLWTTTFVAMLAWPTAGRGRESVATWLDEPRPAPWNTPGLAIPAAPNMEPVEPRCREMACSEQPVVIPVSASTTQSASSSSAITPLEGPYWKAIELAGKPTPAQDPLREAHLQFQAGGRVSGSDGCNRLTGTYKRSGDRLTFGQMAGTQMACVDATDTEGPFRNALKNVVRFTISADRLEFFDASGTRLAVFSATTPPPGPSSKVERRRAPTEDRNPYLDDTRVTAVNEAAEMT